MQPPSEVGATGLVKFSLSSNPISYSPSYTGVEPSVPLVSFKDGWARWVGFGGFMG